MLIGKMFLLFLIGSTTAPATSETNVSAYEEDIRTKFQVNREEIDRLVQLVEGEVNLSIIGKDRVGEYWAREGGWYKDDWRKIIDEQTMLDVVGLPSDRYDRYMSLLRELNAYRVEKRSDRIRIYIRRWGDVVTGGMWNIVMFTRDPKDLMIVDSLTDEYIYGVGEAEFYVMLGGRVYIEYRRQ